MMNNFPSKNFENTFNENLDNENNRGGKNPPPKKHFDFKCCKDNTIKSLHDVEHFLNNFQHYFKYFKLYKLLK